MQVGDIKSPFKQHLCSEIIKIVAFSTSVTFLGTHHSTLRETLLCSTAIKTIEEH